MAASSCRLRSCGGVNGHTQRQSVVLFLLSYRRMEQYVSLPAIRTVSHNDHSHANLQHTDGDQLLVLRQWMDIPAFKSNRKAFKKRPPVGR